MENDDGTRELVAVRPPWNKGKLIGAKPPLRPSHVWSIRTKLQMAGRKRDLALFNLAIDSKLRGCDVVALRVDDVAPSGYAMDRATIRQSKTGRPVRFELTDQTRLAIDEYRARACQVRHSLVRRTKAVLISPADITVKLADDHNGPEADVEALAASGPRTKRAASKAAPRRRRQRFHARES
jgi:hypothetical protein